MPSMEPTILPRIFYIRHPRPVARNLLGKRLVRRVDGQTKSGMITETEAYGPPPEDPAVRLEGMRGLRNWKPGLAWTSYLPRGRATINVTTDSPSCVLISSVEPASE
jgi:3-methyladenine DNA glycosylase Mpg